MIISQACFWFLIYSSMHFEETPAILTKNRDEILEW